MPQRRLLHVDSSRLSAWLWHGGSLRHEGAFGADEAGVAAFSAYLAQHRSSLWLMLADVAEEGFQFEAIPHVLGADRTALVRRKLNQFFYGSPFTTALSLGREKTGRRDERMLFAALTRPQAFEPWLAAMRAAEAQLVGIYSAPLLVPTLGQRLKLRADNCLVVSFGSAGIRQTFLEAGRLRFSRLSPLTAGVAEEVAYACAAEAARTYQYLAGQRLIRNAVLPVVILAPTAFRGALAAACISSDELQYEIVDLPSVAAACGLKRTPDDFSSDLLFLQMLATQQPRAQFASPPERRFYRLWQTRFALKSVAAVVMFACLLFAANELYEVRALREETARIQAQTEADSRRYAGILDGLPAMPTTLDNLRAVVARFDAMAGRSAGPQEMYARISRALEETPEVEAERIEWFLSTNPEQAGAAREPTPLPTAAGGAAPPPGMHAVALISGTLPLNQAGDQRALLETVNDFVAALRRDAALSVSVLRMPVDVESGKTLRSGGEAAAATEAPRFALRVSYPLAVATK